MISAFHGLNAYRGTKNSMMQRLAAKRIIGNDISVADRPIGAVGVCCSGRVREAYSRDCWSEVKNGVRYPNAWNHGMVEREIHTQQEFHAFTQNARAYEGDYYRYSEAFMVVDAIDYVWVKEWANDQTQRNARLLAKLLGSYCLTVTSQTKIQDHWEEFA